MKKDSIGARIGKYTKYQRQKRNLSLNAFAKKISLTTSFLLRLERGTYQNVKFDVIEKLAAGFAMTVEDFLLKCEIISYSQTVPPIEYYLKEMYQFPKDAIEDTKLFIDFLNIKYKKQIKELKTIHKNYWNKEK